MLEGWKTEGGHRRIQRASVDRLLYRNSATPPENPDPIAEPAQALRQTLRVVVVDDDPHLLRLYAVRLQTWSARVQLQTFDNAYAALLAVGRQAPDLLLLDLHMPELDGFSMLKILSQAREMQDTRIVVVSGLDAQGIAARGGIPPDIDVLPKPVPFDRLEALGHATLLRSRRPQVIPSISVAKATP
jgi:DNA-binding response OmpR family regulator